MLPLGQEGQFHLHAPLPRHLGSASVQPLWAQANSHALQLSNCVLDAKAFSWLPLTDLSQKAVPVTSPHYI